MKAVTTPQTFQTMGRILTFAFLWLGLMYTTFGQDITAYYRIAPGNTDDTVMVYLQSNTSQALYLRALNFSFVFKDSCAAYEDYTFAYRSQWTSAFERAKEDSNLQVTYGNTVFNRRLSFGSADGNFATRAPILVPGNNAPKLFVLAVAFSGGCKGTIYMENQQENFRNEFADTLLNTVSYRLQQFNPLSITELAIAAKPIGPREVHIRWHSLFEVVDGDFYVEKSLHQDFRDIQALGTRPATDWQGAEWVDAHAYLGLQYYRIRYTSTDGQTSFSPVASVRIADDVDLFDLDIYPNPVVGYTPLSHQSPGGSRLPHQHL